MFLMKNLTKIFIFLGLAFFAISCVPKATEKKASCGKNEAFDTVTRSCFSIEEIRRVPVGTASSATLSEETPLTINLSYTDANLDKAISCKVSAVSSSIQAISPLVENGGIFLQADIVRQAALNLASSIPNAPPTADSAAALLLGNSIQLAYDKALKSFYYPTLVTEIGLLNSAVNSLLLIANNYPLDTTVQFYYNLSQTEMGKLAPMISMVNNFCECSAGVCRTTIAPRLNKTGVAGFSYTIIDSDGESLPKTVALTIAPMPFTTGHLRPTAQSVHPLAFNESNTSTPLTYVVNLPSAGDLSGTSPLLMRYFFNGAKTLSNKGITAFGLVTNCMDLQGSSGLNDVSCSYVPNSGDGNDGGVIPTKASVGIDDLNFTAISEGSFGNSISIQYFDLQTNNLLIDPFVTKTQTFGLVNSSSESFIRVVGNAIKIFINPGVTSSNDIQAMINTHPQASRLVLVSGALGNLPDPVMLTPVGIFLAGGSNGYDKIPYYADNLLSNSINTSEAIISLNPINDFPMVPKTYIPLFSQSVTFLEEESKNVTLGFTDVDSFLTNMSYDIRIDTVTPVCSTIMSNGAFSLLLPSAYFNIINPGPSIGTCNLSGVCTVDVSISANLDFNGNACLYYTVTDLSGAVSAVQSVNIIVNGINDAPLLSSTNSLPGIITPLPDTAVNEDLAPGFPSYLDIYTHNGGDVFEANQLLSVSAISSLPSLVPNVPCRNYTPVPSTPVGAIIPSAIGIYYFDTNNLRCYVSTGIATANDWSLYPSLTPFPDCPYDYFGQGTPLGIVVPSSAGKHYLDTTNNLCYKSGSTLSSSWAQDPGISHYRIAYVPTKDQSGITNIAVTVGDNGGILNGGVNTTFDTFQLTVNFINDPPVYLSTITSIETNEGGAVQSNAFLIDEDLGSTSDEDAQGITINNIVTDNNSVLPPSSITFFYDLNDNGVEDLGEARTVGSQLENIASDNVKLHNLYLKFDPVDGVSGNANVILTISDGTSLANTSFSFIVHPVAALHGGWNNISSVGIKLDKNGTPVAVADKKCNFNKIIDTHKCSGNNCTGPGSPNSVITPDFANVLYWDSSAEKCYRSTANNSFSWVEMNTSCPITRKIGTCADDNCIIPASPIGGTLPSFVGQYVFNSTNNSCYVSTGLTNMDWVPYVPSKITLAWKPYIMVGSGADSGVQIAGWNIYRREAGADYNFKGGHLWDLNSNATFSITNPLTRTFTDTTAIAGKVYYYVVRPVDTIRNFPTYTPETFSEVRVFAPPANYSFVHRWIVNQEICNSMNMTNITVPNAIDQTQNFRCPYWGPGESLLTPGYFDYGKDLLVDTQELGCAYAPAPKCTANGCVGIGAPGTIAGIAIDDLYYDRNAGTCYRFNGGAWEEMDAPFVPSNILATTLKSALNAPLVKITESRAEAFCSARLSPSGTNLTFTTPTATLPTKIDYNIYSSHKINITDPEITDLEQGFSLNIQSRCNGSSASGLETAYTDSAIPSTTFIYSLPGTFSSQIRSLLTGSIPWGSSKGTEACVSRFGIQDLYGNVAEWTKDKMSCPDASNFVCTASLTSSFGSYDFNPSVGGVQSYAFDLSTGPFNDSDSSTPGPSPFDSYLTNWVFSNEFFNAGKFNFPAGMPINNDIFSLTSGVEDSPSLPFMLDIGPSSGITTNKLHEDGIIVNGSAVNLDPSKTGAFAVGGSYLSGNMAGRYSSELVPLAVKRADIGLRCIIPIDKNDYPSDLKHDIYPY